MTDHSFPKVSIIVPHYQHDIVLKECLTALLSQQYQGKMQIYVVDNSENYALTHIESHYPDIIFMHEAKAGSYHARNKALQHINDGIVAFTDADCRPHPDWVMHGVMALTQDPQYKQVGGKVMITPHKTGTITLTDLYEMICTMRQDRFIKHTQFAITANLFTYYEVFKDTGFFDGTLKSGGDYRWTHHAHSKGYPLIYSDKAIVEHRARNYGQIIHKIKRLTTGKRDGAPKIQNAFRESIRIAKPDKNIIQDIMQYNDYPISRMKRIMVVLFYLHYRLLYGLFYAQAVYLKTDSVR